jgi:hypothetical protein
MKDWGLNAMSAFVLSVSLAAVGGMFWFRFRLSYLQGMRLQAQSLYETGEFNNEKYLTLKTPLGYSLIIPAGTAATDLSLRQYSPTDLISINNLAPMLLSLSTTNVRRISGYCQLHGIPC